RVTVLPAEGARIGSLIVAGHELLVTQGPDRMRWGSYPMVPYAGRIRNGRFAFRGRAHQLPLGMPPHAIHGVVYDRPWQVADARPWEVGEGGTRRSALDARWRYGGRVTRRGALDGDALRQELTLEAFEPMPGAVGWHPWFRRSLGPGEPDVNLTFAADEMLVRDGDGIPTDVRVPPPAGPWDDIFSGVGADPELEWPGRIRLTLSSTCAWWTVFTEPEHAVCVEPQSDPPDAVNATPFVVEPGSPLRHTMTWRWTRL